MKPYRILRTFLGNQTGNGPTEKFTEGSTAMLSDSLAEVVLKEGWVEPVSPKAALAKVQGLDKPVPEGKLKEDLENPAELRETKVIEAAETKPAKPAAKKGKK